MKPTYLSALSFLILILCWATLLHGHIGEPLSTRVWTVEGSWVLEGNFGAMTPDSDEFVCEEAFLGGDRFFIVPLLSDTWLAFSGSKVYLTEDGCDFRPLDDLPVLPSDVDVDEASQMVAFVMNPAGQSSLLRTFAQGELMPAFPFSDGVQLTSVRILDAQTLIVGGYLRDEAGQGVLYRVSLEANSVEDITPEVPMTYPYVLDADFGQILWLGRIEEQSLHWGTPDDPYRDSRPITSWPTDARLVDEHSIVIAGLRQSRGLTIGDRSAGEIVWTELVEEMSAVCVRPYLDGFLVCTLRRFDGADLMYVRAGFPPEPMVTFTDLKGARTCPDGSSVQNICPAVWPEIARQLGLTSPIVPMEPEPMEPDVEIPEDMPPPTQTSDSSICATGTGSSGLILLILLGYRRGRNRRS